MVEKNIQRTTMMGGDRHRESRKINHRTINRSEKVDRKAIRKGPEKWAYLAKELHLPG